MVAFRQAASFGKRIEFWIVGRMLKAGMDVYMPLVDDQGVDAIVRRRDGSVALVQIKARSSKVAAKAAALFAGIPQPKKHNDYWFVFYSERMERPWLMTSAEFIKESYQSKTGKHAGLRTIWFNGTRCNHATGAVEEHVKPQFEKYLTKDFARLRRAEPRQRRSNNPRVSRATLTT